MGDRNQGALQGLVDQQTEANRLLWEIARDIKAMAKSEAAQAVSLEAIAMSEAAQAASLQVIQTQTRAIAAGIVLIIGELAPPPLVRGLILLGKPVSQKP